MVKAYVLEVKDVGPNGEGLILDPLGIPQNGIVDMIEAPNLVVDAGFIYLAKLLQGGFPEPSHVAVGTDNTAPAAGNLSLVAAVFQDVITQRIPIVDGMRIRFFLSSTSAMTNGSCTMNIVKKKIRNGLITYCKKVILVPR